MSGPHFRDYHLLLDEHGAQIFAMADPIAERARKIGGTTIRSIGHIDRLRRVKDTTPAMSIQKTCLQYYVQTTSGSLSRCARFMASATSMAT